MDEVLDEGDIVALVDSELHKPTSNAVHTTKSTVENARARIIVLSCMMEVFCGILITSLYCKRLHGMPTRSVWRFEWLQYVRQSSLETESMRPFTGAHTTTQGK